MRVVSYEKQGKVTLQNLVTGNTDEYHISRLRPFYYENEAPLKRLLLSSTALVINLHEKRYSFACDGLDTGKTMTNGNLTLI